ncbi:hypothetical protein Tsubulata_017204 [Turnera subulata]|uniref:F-box domain-containing protein n=1 Tax=Turnera subulata TaxID=218843 RepID=A0A9Q0JA90_9ROSI|nr:hypothetical protein Tsubulata_017204 [Turnera subulata]
MEGRKWEDLEINCLVNVLGRVGMESLLMDVPFVCKSWYRASLEPKCWKEIVLHGYSSRSNSLWSRFEDEYEIRNFTITKLIKLITNRSNGNCTVFDVSCSFRDEVLQELAEKCPSLMRLSLRWLTSESFSILPQLMGKWKLLEYLGFPRSSYAYKHTRGEINLKFRQILQEISLNCNKFWGLHLFNDVGGFGEEEISPIVTYLPKVKYLYLYGMCDEKHLKTILLGCGELVHLEVGKVGYWAWELDEEMIKLASHINTFIYK